MKKDAVLVILGAGASFDSLPLRQLEGVDRSWRPPLTCELFQQRPSFEKLFHRFPETADLASRLRERISNGEDFEALLDKVVEEARVNEFRSRQLLSLRFYLHYLLSSVSTNWPKATSYVSNYSNLTDKLNQWRKEKEGRREVVYVTFNYDTLLESAAARTSGFDWSSTSSYVNPNGPLRVFKPHGSVNWVQRLNHDLGVLADEHYIARAREVAETLGPVIHLADAPADARRIPAISVPLLSKAAFCCPEDHLTALEELIPSITHVIAIGWKGREGHFNRLIQGRFSQDIDLLVAAGNQDEAKEIASRLTKSWKISVNSLDLIGGFSQLVHGETLDPFLARGWT